MKRRLILASKSPARKRLLKRLGYKFHAVPADLDEDSFKAKSPRELVRILAGEKARKVFEGHPQAIVIGSDQVLLLGKRIFGKPRTAKNAISQLSACVGKTVQLLTAVTVIVPTAGGGKAVEHSFLNITKLTFHKLKLKEIEDYVELDRPLACAGSFMFERNGIRLFSKIQTDDPTAIEGLPTVALNSILRHALNA
jgi:septum formation protein